MKVDFTILNSKVRAEIIQFLLERYLACLIAIDYSLSEIARGIGSSKGALVYALRELEGAGVIRLSKKKGRLNIQLNPSHVLITRVIEAELLGAGTLSLDLEKEVQGKVILLEKALQECQHRRRQLETDVKALQAGIKRGALIEFVKNLATSVVGNVLAGGFATIDEMEEFVVDLLLEGIMDKYGVFVGDV